MYLVGHVVDALALVLFLFGIVLCISILCDGIAVLVNNIGSSIGVFLFLLFFYEKLRKGKVLVIQILKEDIVVHLVAELGVF